MSLIGRRQLLLALLLEFFPWNASCFSVSTHFQFGMRRLDVTTTSRTAAGQRMAALAAESSKNAEVDEENEWVSAKISEVIQNDGNEEEDQEWLPDREKAKRKRQKAQASQSAAVANRQVKPKPTTPKVDANTSAKEDQGAKASPYTDEEEEVIRSMGGKTKMTASKREPGYLGDCTLQDIATDYSVPVCYLADVLCMWGAPVPIDIHDRLGDLVTGEQAFAMLEAVNSLDVAALHDRYSNQSLINVCGDCNIDLSEAFEMAIKEGWSLPFGVQTVLRVEQEEDLLRVLGGMSL